MAQPAPTSSDSYYQFPLSQPAPAPSPSQTLTPSTQPSSKPAVTSDAYCLYTAQGEIICNKKADNLAVAPWGHEK
jgi:hypothetical protein